MSEQFTNRRGHSLVIDDEEVLTVDSVVEPIKLPKKKPKRRSKRASQVVKGIVFVVACLLIVVLATFEIVRFSFAVSVESARRQVDELVAGDVSLAAQKSPLEASTISSLQNKFKDVSMSLCPGGLFDNYASLYPRAKSALDDCTLYRSKVESLAVALGGMSDATRYLERLKPVFAPLTEPLPDRFAVLSSQQESWRTALTTLKEITPPYEFQSAHHVLVERVSAISSAWTHLVAASNTRNSAVFREIRDSLPGMYGAVRVSADDMEQVLSSVQTRLSGAYESLK